MRAAAGRAPGRGALLGRRQRLRPSGPDVDVDVLVVGSGPMGSTTALALARYGVSVRVVTKRRWLADGPRAHVTNQRAMEVFRDLGVEEAVSADAVPWELMGDMVFATSVAGPEVARMHAFGSGPDRLSDYLTGSPCPMADVPQPLLEPVLVDAAAVAGAEYAFCTEYLSHTQDEDGVTTTVLDRLSGHRSTVRSRYLVGADGAGSKVVQDAGLRIEGVMGRAASMYTVFSADLARYVAHRPSVLHWIMNPAVGFGEIGMGTLRAVRPWDLWIAGWGYDPDAGEPATEPAAVLPTIRAMIGDLDVAVEVHSTSTWRINQAWAPVYSAGRVHCGGDAVHRHPPSGGLGSNTSVQDGFNLAWKLAHVVKGWAHPRLLESYSDERAPVGEQVVAHANRARTDYQPIADLFRTGVQDDPVAAGVARLRDPGPQGVADREALSRALELKDTEHNAHGTELNQRYASCAVVPDEAAGPEVWRRDPGLHLQATTRPGAKVPHVWLVDEAGRKLSTLDVTGGGRFSLLTGLAGGAWRTAAEALDLPHLRTVVIGDAGVRDPYLAWHRVREVAEAGAVLVRPDGYVAWRCAEPVTDPQDAQTRLRGAVAAVLGAQGLAR
ncbi:FAD-dependent monooxygenase [Kineococcus sp. LSe6-4]|uniref:FAD-dependent monooxygenase n=1 Tax=Kineococcus halophytocola TaxID=3234027 RepID=A0ABV4H0S1_9ACTN